MGDIMKPIETTVAQWDGIVARPHRFGGIQFNLGKVEIGHFHAVGLVDVPFTIKIKNRLILEGKALDHHILGNSGWISFWVTEDEDVHHAIWLFRLSYLHKIKARSRGNSAMSASRLDLIREIRDLKLSAALQDIVSGSGRDLAE